MRMKSEGFGNIEIVGDITRIRRSGDYLIMNVDTTTPVGWHVVGALTHKDLVTIMKQLFKPSNLFYLFFGFGKPGKANQNPNYGV